MAEAKVDNPAPTDLLEEQVDALLNDVQAALHEVEQRMCDTPLAVPEAPGANAFIDDSGSNAKVQKAATILSQRPAGENSDAAELELDQQLESEMMQKLSDEPVAEGLPQPTLTMGEHKEHRAGEGQTAARAEELAISASTASEVVTALPVSPVSPASPASPVSPQSPSVLTSEKIKTPSRENHDAAESLDAAVSSMVADAAAALEKSEKKVVEPVKVHTSQAPKVETSREPVSVEDLDSQLASLTEQLIEETGPEMNTPIAAAPLPAVLHTAPTAPVAAAVRATTPVKAETSKTTVASAAALLKAAPARVGSLSPLLVKVFSPLSAPLNRFPRVVRDTLGWVSLITLFWAGTIWAYLLFFHKPVESEVPQSATKISGVAPSETGHDKMEHGSPTHGGKQKANGAEHAPAASGDHAAASEKPADSKKPHDAHKIEQSRGGH